MAAEPAGAALSYSLLMPNRDNGAILDRVLGRLADSTGAADYELIVVDDGSTDDSRAPREHRARLAHQYAYWREKWGFDILNPDVDALERRWGQTEVGWRTDPARRRAGEEILERWA